MSYLIVKDSTKRNRPGTHGSPKRLIERKWRQEGSARIPPQ